MVGRPGRRQRRAVRPRRQRAEPGDRPAHQARHRRVRLRRASRRRHRPQRADTVFLRPTLHHRGGRRPAGRPRRARQHTRGGETARRSARRLPRGAELALDDRLDQPAVRRRAVKALEVIGWIATVLGLIFAFAMSGFVVLVGAGERWARRRLAGTVAYRCGELLVASAYPRLAIVSGTVAATPGGVVCAPLSGVQCVWYRLSIWREYENGDGTFDEVIWTHEPVDRFGIDDGSGVVYASARLLGRDLIEGSAAQVTESPWVPAPDWPATLSGLGILPPAVAARI